MLNFFLYITYFLLIMLCLYGGDFVLQESKKQPENRKSGIMIALLFFLIAVISSIYLGYFLVLCF